MADKARIARCKITHMTNLENMAVEFPFVLEDLEEIKPFDQAPWDPGPWQQQQQQRQYKEGRTKYTQKAEIKRLAETTWQAQWEAESQTRKTVASHLRRIVKDDFKQGQELYKAIKHRNSCAILTQLRTGHCGLNGYLSKVKKIESAKCDYCGYEKETVEHFLLECPQFQEQRIILRRKVGTRQMVMASLLGNKEVAKATLEYVTSTRRFKVEGGKGARDRRREGDGRR